MQDCGVTVVALYGKKAMYLSYVFGIFGIARRPLLHKLGYNSNLYDLNGQIFSL